MEYTRDITLNIIPDSSIPIVRAKQGDASVRFIRAVVVMGHDIYIPGADQTILFREEKPDGTGVILDSTYEDVELGRYLVTIDSDGAVIIELVEQTTTCPGLCKCDLCFIQDGKTISSASFVLDIDTAPDVSSIAVSSDDFRTLINALEDVGLSSTTQLSDMTDVQLTDISNNQIVVFNNSTNKWCNRDASVFGFLTEEDVNALINAKGYQTVTQINQLIADYVNSLDANTVAY